ncbi:MAG: non-canonical purine NTP diphosphatase [Flavobacteriales bacterium]|nr:non-canonical purine NTP diphosphatase [Flavobacteriales bacterium]
MKLVFATNNPNKIAEIKSLIPFKIEILSLKDINCNKELPETQTTLEGNAMQKAEFVFDNYGYNCFADDTGLEVNALNNEPGVYSARYAGEDCNSEENMQKVLQNLEGKNNRKAKFRTVIALIIDGEKYLFEGECKGEIIKEKIGEKGFGYDPIFLPKGFDTTFAQMTKQEKGIISHRGIATRKLLNFLQTI